MSEANKFIDELRHSMQNEIFTTTKAKVVSVKGNTADVKPLSTDLPLLINLPITTVKADNNFMEHSIEVGDEVLVAFNNSDKSSGVIVGTVLKGDTMTWEEYIVKVVKENFPNIV